MMKSVSIALFLTLLAPSAMASEGQATVEEVFDPTYRNGLVMQIEASIAEAQAKHGVISEKAAREIRRKASVRYAPLDDIAKENDIVHHRMVALLNVWRRSLSEEGQASLHFGATTVDIYDTVRILQIKDSIALMREEMLGIERKLIALAEAHRDTPMVGRTLGQHALPITLGKKVAVWAAANRRNIERLNDLECRLDELGVFRGAVGTHLGLGEHGIEIEREVSASLGLGPTSPADWHGMRDVFGEYAMTLALMSRTYAGIGEEVFRLQMTDIGEVYEDRPGTAISSSTMPHKRNPSRSESLIHYGRVIPAKAEILLDDVANVFERDNTSRPNRTIEEISIESADMLSDLATLLDRLKVDEDRMAENLARTDGMILAQRIVFTIQGEVGKEEAEERVTMAARTAMAEKRSFRSVLLEDEEIGPLLEDRIDALLDPSSYIGLSAEQVDETSKWLSARTAVSRCGQ